MRLQLSTWQEVEAYLGRSKGIIVPVGSTEQHGPNGLIGTDAICPETVADAVAERMEAMVGPTLSIGMAQHHMAFPGTITFRPSTFMAVLKDVIGSLERHGFERVYFLNGHGGNIATITAAFSEVYAARSMAGEANVLRCRLANWFGGTRVKKLTRELYGDTDGRHATASEVSLSYFAHPEAVKTVTMEPKVAPVGEIRDALDYRRQFPDGRIGSDPSRASVEDGRRLCEAAVEDVLADYTAFLGEG